MKVCLATLIATVSLSAFATDYNCKGTGVEADLRNSETTLEVTLNGKKTSYTIDDVSSRTGDIDETYSSSKGVSLTIDEQYEDSLEIDGKSIPVVCDFAP